MNNPLIDQKKRFADVTIQMRDNAHIIHYLGILKPWFYRNKPMYSDVALYAGLWFDCERAVEELKKAEHHHDAKEELAHYKKKLFGGWKRV